MESISVTVNSTLSFQSSELRLSEIEANPTGNNVAGDKYQYIDIADTVGTWLNNVYLVMINPNSSTLGIVNYVANHTECYVLSELTGVHAASIPFVT